MARWHKKHFELLSKRSNNEGPSSALGPFQRGLGRPGTSGESHGDVEIGKTEVALWQAACLLSQWAEEKERKRIDTFVSSLLLPLWAAGLGERNGKELEALGRWH